MNGPSPPLAAVLTYDAERAAARAAAGAEVVRGPRQAVAADGTVRIALIGAGGFVTNVHLPNIKADPAARVQIVANRSGTSASDAARLAGGADTTTDWRQAIGRDDVDLVIIGTRHDSHAEIAAQALRAGKAVFVEKPLGAHPPGDRRGVVGRHDNQRLAIGFNRPFSPLAQALHDELSAAGAYPVHLIYRVSSPLPTDHWLNDPATGGGRVLGEACHMFDFANWLCGRPERVWAAALPAPPALRTPETVSVTVRYETGSVATVHYSGVGAASMPKERVEVLSSGRSWVLEDFVSLTTYEPDGPRTRSERRADKGHAALMSRVLAACRGSAPFEPGLRAAYAAQSVALGALESLATGEAIDVVQPPRPDPQ